MTRLKKTSNVRNIDSNIRNKELYLWKQDTPSTIISTIKNIRGIYKDYYLNYFPYLPQYLMSQSQIITMIIVNISEAISLVIVTTIIF